MALGALIGAYQEDDSGALRALLPLAGRTLIEYQARCAAAAGATPVVALVETIPAALEEAFARLRQEGVAIIAVSSAAEAASRFEPGELVLLVGDGIAPPVSLVTMLAAEDTAAVLTLPDDEEHQQFERIDAVSRWAGLALVEGRTLASTAAILGDWDLQSTLLRRSLQEGAVHVPVRSGEAEPLLADGPEGLAGFERGLITASRGPRPDVSSRILLPLVEDFATERLLETRVRAEWLVYAALAATIVAAFLFTRGWHWPALALLILSTPLDLIGDRLGKLRLRPLSQDLLSRRLLWPAAGLALIALGWWESRHGGGWGAFFAAVTAGAFAQALRQEMAQPTSAGEMWLFSRRNAVFAAIPFAAFGAWTALLPALAVYAAASFFFTQHLRHHIQLD